jgi:hypothetical protein
LYSYVDDQLVTWKKGAQYKFECKIKRTKTVGNVPFVDGTRDEGSVQSNTTTLFEMGRCTNDTCIEIDNNAILDVSPYSKEDPLIWFKVSSLINDKYTHLRQCWYSWQPIFIELAATDPFTIIEDGCSINSKMTNALAPFTVLSESRGHLHYDSFGHLLGSVST